MKNNYEFKEKKNLIRRYINLINSVGSPNHVYFSRFRFASISSRYLKNYVNSSDYNP